jgi:hypothetical protein
MVLESIIKLFTWLNSELELNKPDQVCNLQFLNLEHLVLFKNIFSTKKHWPSTFTTNAVAANSVAVRLVPKH